MMLDRSFGSSVSQSCAYHRRTASSRSRRAGSLGAADSTSKGIASLVNCLRRAASFAAWSAPSPTGVQDHAANSVPSAWGARSAIRTRTVPGGSTSASTSAILRAIRSGSSVQR